MTENSFTPRPDYWAELQDVISDAISDSIDQDWTPSTGATYVVEALKKEPMFAAAPELAAFAEYVLEMDPDSDAPLFVRARQALSRARGGE